MTTSDHDTNNFATNKTGTAGLSTSLDIVLVHLWATSPPSFVPRNCSNSSYIGSYCNVSRNPCDDTSKPCRNSGKCTNDFKLPHGYYCTCPPDFTGTNCDDEVGPCKLNTCLYNGTCTALNSTNFQCNCTEGHIGMRCEYLIDYCHNVTCFNKGRCRSLPPGYKCHCLSASYSGRHCEHVASSIIDRQYALKTFGYIAIIALSMVAGFVVITGILKYVFGIDPVHEVREQIRRRRAALGRKNPENQKLQNIHHLRRIIKVSPEQNNPNTKQTIAGKY